MVIQIHVCVRLKQTSLDFFSVFFFFFLSAACLTTLGLSARARVRASVCRQVVLRGVGGEGVSVVVVRVVGGVIGGGFSAQSDASVVVSVDGFAEVYGVLQFLLQDQFTRVPRQLEQEEARVRLWQEVVRRVVLIQHLGV